MLLFFFLSLLLPGWVTKATSLPWQLGYRGYVPLGVDVIVDGVLEKFLEVGLFFFALELLGVRGARTALVPHQGAISLLIGGGFVGFRLRFQEFRQLWLSQTKGRS